MGQLLTYYPEKLCTFKSEKLKGNEVKFCSDYIEVDSYYVCFKCQIGYTGVYNSQGYIEQCDSM